MGRLDLSEQYEINEISLWMNYNNDSLYFIGGDVKVELFQEEEKWVKNINVLCQTEVLSRIIYNDNRILFGMDGNHYAFVYSVDESILQYMSVLLILLITIKNLINFI